MAAFSITSCFERSGLIAREVSKRRNRPSLSATASMLLVASGVSALCLGSPSEVRATPTQIWQFTVAITLNALPVPVQPIPPVEVSSNGAFGFTITSTPPGPCPPIVNSVPVTGMLAAGMTVTANNGTVCGDPVNNLTARGPLNAPFPNATSGSATGSGPVGLGTLTVTVNAVCTSGCASGPSQQVAQATAGAQQAATLGTIALATTSVQTTNIGLRLAALRRGGATGVSMSGLSLSIDGQSLPLGALTGMIPSGERGGGASADRSGFLSRLGFFANGQGSFGAQDATSREPGFDFHTAGITLGADYRLTDQVLLGMAFGYLRTKSDFDSSAGNSTTNGYSLSAYGSYYILDKLYVDGIATFGWNNYNTDRNIPNVNATANGSTDGTQFAISVSTGYNFNAGAFTFGPTGRVNYVRVHVDGYQETGAEPFNLNIGSQTPESVTTALGGQATYAISTQWAVLTPLVRFEWEHEYKGGSRTVTANVVADPATSVAVQTNNPDRDYFNLGAGLSATFKQGVSAFLYYETVLGRANFTNNAFTGGVRFEF